MTGGLFFTPWNSLDNLASHRCLRHVWHWCQPSHPPGLLLPQKLQIVLKAFKNVICYEGSLFGLMKSLLGVPCICCPCPCTLLMVLSPMKLSLIVRCPPEVRFTISWSALLNWAKIAWPKAAKVSWDSCPCELSSILQINRWWVVAYVLSMLNYFYSGPCGMWLRTSSLRHATIPTAHNYVAVQADKDSFTLCCHFLDLWARLITWGITRSFI